MLCEQCGHPWSLHMVADNGGANSAGTSVECFADGGCDCVMVQPCGVPLHERIAPEFDLGGESG